MRLSASQIRYHQWHEEGWAIMYTEDELYHYKYWKKKRGKNGKWQYYYRDKKEGIYDDDLPTTPLDTFGIVKSALDKISTYSNRVKLHATTPVSTQEEWEDRKGKVWASLSCLNDSINEYKDIAKQLKYDRPHSRESYMPSYQKTAKIEKKKKLSFKEKL